MVLFYGLPGLFNGVILPPEPNAVVAGDSLLATMLAAEGQSLLSDS